MARRADDAYSVDTRRKRNAAMADSGCSEWIVSSTSGC